VLGLAGAIALFQHLSARQLTARLYLLAGFGLWALLVLCQFAGYCFRNLVWGKHLARTTVAEVSGACHLSVDVPRRWKVRAGQYVYLWFPTASLSSFFQSHPYMIIWWKESGKTGLKLSILVEGKGGLSKRLPQLSQYELPTLIGGPHGELHDFGQFGTCLMFATDIGIASVLPHIKAVVDGYRRFEVCTRRIVLVWQIKQEGMNALAMLAVDDADTRRLSVLGSNIHG
jgi:FAD-binding domain